MAILTNSGRAVSAIYVKARHGKHGFFMSYRCRTIERNKQRKNHGEPAFHV